jgi:hypothetical protein
MQVKTMNGMMMEVDPQDQDSINGARQRAGAGQGVGPAVQAALIQKIWEGKITRHDELPEEYRAVLGRMLTNAASAPAP